MDSDDLRLTRPDVPPFVGLGQKITDVEECGNKSQVTIIQIQ